MKPQIDEEEMRKRKDKDALAKADMANEGGVTWESYHSDPRINEDEYQKNAREKNN